MSDKTAYPLYWPVGRTRCKLREKNSRFQTSFAEARDNCAEQIRMLGGRDVVVSTNIPLKRNGSAYAKAWGESIPEPGVAVYFKRNGVEMCFACDCWTHVQDNMHAIAKTIEALRGIARWGTGDMMEAAFRGFKALPEKTSGLDPWDILGITPNASELEITAAFKSRAKICHPDIPGTGSPTKFAELRAAHDMAMQNTRKT